MIRGQILEVWRRNAVLRSTALLAVTTILLGSLARWDAAVAQIGTRGSATTGGYAARSAATSFEQKFWNWLQSVHYRNWAPVPGKTGEATAGQSPHGAFVKMYLNRTAAGHPNELPNGSIIVKENYGPDGKTLMAVTVMYRSRGFDPQHGDWYWVKYGADGAVATMNGMKLAGRVKGCIECHQGADGDDWAFFNDR